MYRSQVIRRVTRAVGQVDAAMAIGITDAHTGYWQCQQTARLVTNPIIGGDNLIGKVITRLSKVGGMTLDPNTHTEGEVFIFRDGSGTLRLVVNFLRFIMLLYLIIVIIVNLEVM